LSSVGRYTPWIRLANIACAAPHAERVRRHSMEAEVQATCRVCFEGGGDLIAPCLCNGSARWIHRDCLNTWRLRGTNPRALTNCCECGFQYRLVLCAAAGNRAQDRWHDMVRRLASETLLGFFVVQAAVVTLGLACHALDRREFLAKLAGDQPALGSTGPLPDLRQHKLIYYCVGAIVLVAVFCAVAIARLACGRCSACGPSAPPGHLVASASGFCSCRACADCCEVCGNECDDCCRPCSCCGGGCPASIGAGTQAVHLFLFLLVVGVLAGIFGFAVALMTSAQKIVQSFAQLQEKRFFVEEYLVQDLADIEGVKSCPAPQLAMSSSEPRGTDDFSADEESRMISSRLPVSYGSTVST